MKNTFASALLLAALALSLGPGCDSGSDKPAPPPPAAAPPPANKNPVADTVQVVTNAVRQATEVVQKTEQQVQQVVQQASAQAQQLLDQANSLLQDKKLQDASGLLDQVSALTLSAEQQQLLTGLKSEFSKLSDDVKNGIQKAQTLVTQKNYTEALGMVSSLSSYQLSTEQKKLVDGIKAEAEKLLRKSATDEGKKALGNLLPK